MAAAQEDWVGGDTYLSDESDFYGDKKTRAKYEKNVRKSLKRRLYHPLACVVVKKVKCEREDDPAVTKDDLAATSPEGTTPEWNDAEARGAENVLDFLKRRPQLAALQASHAKTSSTPKNEAPRTLSTRAKANDLVENHCTNGDPACWQKGENVVDFLRRAPVADQATADLGPWLWVHSAMIPYQHKKRHEGTDVPALRERGELLLAAFGKQQSIVESQNEGKAPATITRKITPYREQLEDDLLGLAVNTSTTYGKWMLFPGLEDLPRYWRIVAEATSQGRLGPTSKVGTPDPFSSDKTGTLICVYTYDFTDEVDVRRVLEELLELGLCRADGRPIYYKCDAYTYLGIESSNPYKLRASLYSSKEILNCEAKPKADGPIVRLKKRNNTINSFLQS